MGSLVYLRVQRMSNSHVVHFDKHICHEKVTTTGDYAVQAVLLTGKIDLCLKRENRLDMRFSLVFFIWISFSNSKEKTLKCHQMTY